MSKSKRFSASERNGRRISRAVQTHAVDQPALAAPKRATVPARLVRIETRTKVELLVVVLLAICAAYALTIATKTSSGVLKLNDGAITYDGGLLHGRMDGNGTMTFDNGDTYTGEFKDGTFNGSGTFTSKDGWKYEGNFTNGEPDGEGTLTTEDSVVYQGTFKQGIYQSAH